MKNLSLSLKKYKFNLIVVCISTILFVLLFSNSADSAPFDAGFAMPEVKDINCENAPSRAKQIIKTNDILFGTTRPMLKRFCIVPEKYDDQICSTGFCVLRIVNNDVLINYIYHCLSTSNFYNFVKDNEQGTTYPAISDNVLKEYTLPLPTLDTQKEIVHYLDQFTALISLLEKKLELTKKQYAYYRDELLRFERK